MLFVIGSSYNFVTAQTSKKADSGIIKLLIKQHTQPKPDVFKELTVQDRKNYVLTIDQSKIGKPHDSVVYKLHHKRKCKVFNVPVKLSNLSNDTLRYLSMTCSWGDSFSIDNKNLSILGWVCESNFSIKKFIVPHKSMTYSVPVAVTNGDIRDDKFRVGMNLLIVDKKNKRFTWGLIPSDFKTKNLIWSNEVQLPK